MSEINSNEWPQLKINALISVKSLEDIGWRQWTGVHEGGHLAFLVSGTHYDFIVIECENSIPPDSTGSAILLTVSDALLSTDTKEGSSVDISGGSTLLGAAQINSIERVWTVRDKNAEKGYRFSRGPIPI